MTYAQRVTALSSYLNGLLSAGRQSVSRQRRQDFSYYEIDSSGLSHTASRRDHLALKLQDLCAVVCTAGTKIPRGTATASVSLVQTSDRQQHDLSELTDASNSGSSVFGDLIHFRQEGRNQLQHAFAAPFHHLTSEIGAQHFFTQQIAQTRRELPRGLTRGCAIFTQYDTFAFDPRVGSIQ